MWVIGLLGCGEAPPVTPPAAPDPVTVEAPIYAALAQHTGMPLAAAQALDITMMPNDTMAATSDPASRLCFLLSRTSTQWSVSFAGTHPPPGLLQALPASTMGHQVDAGAAVAWMGEHCGQP